MKLTRSFRKSRKSNRSRKNRTRGGKQPSILKQRIRPRSSQMGHYLANAAFNVVGDFITVLIYIFTALAIFAKINEINEPWNQFSPSVHFSDNPHTYRGLIHVPRSLPGPSALQNINLMKSPSFTSVSKHSIGKTPLQFAHNLGIPPKYTSRSDFLPSDMYWMEALRQLDLGPTSTIKHLIEKIVEEAEGDKKEDIKKALLEADKMANSNDILSRSRSSAAIQLIRDKKSASKSR